MSRPTRRYDGIILHLHKAGPYQGVVVFTKQAGIVRVFSRTSRKGKQGFGSLQPLGAITFDALPQENSLHLSEYDCRSNPAMRELTLDRYIYSQLFVEIIEALVPPAEPDASVYTLLCTYCQAIGTKDIRMVTIIAGWQLVALAGFAPDLETVRLCSAYNDLGESVYYIGDEVPEQMQEIPLSAALKRDWQQVLAYRWGQTETVHFQSRHVALLEQLLYQYVVQCSEKPLRSLALWQDIQKTTM